MVNVAQGRAPADLEEHLARLDPQGLMTRIARPIDMDTELQSLVRWQFQGGFAEQQRLAFLFTEVRGAKDEGFDMPVLVGAMAASPAIYAAGLEDAIEEIGPVWLRAINAPIARATPRTWSLRPIAPAAMGRNPGAARAATARS